MAFAASLAHSFDSLILMHPDGRSSLFVGPFPRVCPFSNNRYQLVTNLTASWKRGNTHHDAHVASNAVAEASGGRLQYVNVPVGDHEKADITSAAQKALPHMLLAWDRGCQILIHCEEGTSRAPTVAAAFIMALQDRGDHVLHPDMLRGRGFANAALDLVQLARPLAQPNPGFRRALQLLAERPIEFGEE